MPYVPEDVEWFLAQLVLEFRVQGHSRNVVHINYVLIQARSPAEAYRKALEEGKSGSGKHRKYLNPRGEEVTRTFLGLRQLEAVYFPIEHGCEVTYEERVGVRPTALRKMVRKKSALDAFQDYPFRGPPGRPDYGSGEILDMVYKELEAEKHAKQTSREQHPVRGLVLKRKSTRRRA